MKNSPDFEAFMKAGENASNSRKNSQTKLCLGSQKKDKDSYITYVRKSLNPNIGYVNNTDDKN